jgi:hypothetical protein
MKHNIDQWLEYKEMMLRIASEYKKKYPMVEVDDLQQEMYLWFVTHPKKFKEWSTLEEKDKDKLIAKSLRNQCLKYSEKEKAKVLGYDMTDLYYYDVSVIEAFLPSIIIESYEMPAKIKDLNLKFSNGEISDGMNWLALRSDIAKGYYKLSEAKQNILRLRFMNEQAEWSDVAEEMGTTADGARMKVQRALASIVQNLGGWRAYHDQDTQEETSESDSETTAEGTSE